MGLSKNEAKVYSAILEYGHCKTTELAEITGLPRTRIYDILSKLTAKQLLEKRKNGKQGYHIIPPSESIDMMRLIENSYKVKLVLSKYETYSVDTEEDLKFVEEKMKNDTLYKSYAGS